MSLPSPDALRAAAQRLPRLPSAPASSGPVAVAVSGGADSIVLLHLLANLRTELALQLSAIHVNHGLSPHAGAARVKRYVGDRVWGDYEKFCVVRNPLDRSVSQFFWTAANRDWHDAATNFHARFDEFLQSNDFHRLNEKGRDVYAIDGRVVADRVLRFETLDQDLGRTMRELGIETPVSLTRFKSTQRPKGDFAAMLNDRQRQVIRDSFAFDIEQFGYVV